MPKTTLERKRLSFFPIRTFWENINFRVLKATRLIIMSIYVLGCFEYVTWFNLQICSLGTVLYRVDGEGDLSLLVGKKREAA